MKKIIFVSLLTILSVSIVSAKEYHCSSEDATHRTLTHFDSTQPLLQNDVFILNPDGSTKWAIREDIMLPNNVCQVGLNIATDCKVTDKDVLNGSAYVYAFECPQQDVRGQFVVDASGNGSFMCNDEPPTQFENCIAQ